MASKLTSLCKCEISILKKENVGRYCFKYFWLEVLDLNILLYFL